MAASNDAGSRPALQRQLDRLSSLLVEEEKNSPPAAVPASSRRAVWGRTLTTPSLPFQARLSFDPVISPFLDPMPTLAGPGLELVEALLQHDHRMLHMPSARGSLPRAPVPAGDYDLGAALLASFNAQMDEWAGRTRPAATAPAPLPEAHLVEQRVEAGGTETITCTICFDDLPVGSSYVMTSCCSTTESPKRLHYKCALHCLRRDDRCPFCKSTRLAFK